MRISIRMLMTHTICLSLFGCANPEIVQVSPNTYLLSKQDRAGIFGNASALKAGVIKQANEFANAQGKVAIPISSKEIPLAPGRFARFDYQFRVVGPEDPEAKRAILISEPNLIVEQRDKRSGETSITHEKPKDLYSELLKLDDLRKKGVLTDTEFEVQKQKILQSK